MEEMRYQYKDGSYLPESSWSFFKIKKYTPHKSTRYVNVDKSDNGTLPELYDKRENCCGCTACFSICPKDAILMEPDEEGFLYPVVDASKCIKCHKCESVCSFKRDQMNKALF